MTEMNQLLPLRNSQISGEDRQIVVVRCNIDILSIH